MNNTVNTLEIELINKFTPDKYHPFYYSLSKIEPKDWLIFGSLTWKWTSRRMDNPRQKQFRDAEFSHLMNVFSLKIKKLYPERPQLRPRDIAYFKTTEYGAVGEMHVHFLIAKDRLEHLDAEIAARTLETLWTETLRPSGYEWPSVGTAVIKPYDTAKEEKGVKYCLKREFDEIGQPREPDDFLSHALMKVIERKSSQQPDMSLN